MRAELERLSRHRSGRQLDCADGLGDSATSIDLLLTEVKLPGDISGLVLASQPRKTKPDLKVVLTYESSQEAQGQPPVPADGSALVPKPYTSARLLEAVQRRFSRRC